MEEKAKSIGNTAGSGCIWLGDAVVSDPTGPVQQVFWGGQLYGNGCWKPPLRKYTTC